LLDGTYDLVCAMGYIDNGNPVDVIKIEKVVIARTQHSFEVDILGTEEDVTTNIDLTGCLYYQIDDGERLEGHIISTNLSASTPVNIKAFGAIMRPNFIDNVYKEIDITRSRTLRNLDSSFYELYSLTSFKIDSFSNIVNIEDAWAYCSSLTTFPIIDTSNVTMAESAWEGCSSLTEFPLLDLSSTTSLVETWKECSSLTSFPLIEMGHITNLWGAWEGCTGLLNFPELNISNVTDISSAWEDCASLSTFPLLDTSSVIKAARSWSRCYSLANFPLIDTSSTIDLNYAWDECPSLIEFPLINVGICANFENSWGGCYGLGSFPLLDFSSAINLDNTWAGCTGLINFPEIIISSAQDLTGTWKNCTALLEFPPLDFSSATTMRQTFKSCSSLVSFPSINTSSCLNFEETFNSCTNLLCLTNIDTSIATTTESMFDFSDSILKPDASERASILAGSNWINNQACPYLAPPIFEVELIGASDTDVNIELTDAYYYTIGDSTTLSAGGAVTLPINSTTPTVLKGYGPITSVKILNDVIKSINITKMDTITNLDQSFKDLTNLTAFEIIDTSNILSMNQSWSGCTSLEYFPIVDTSACINFEKTFEYCSSLKCISNINTLAAQNTTDILHGCNDLIRPTPEDIISISGGADWVNFKGCPYEPIPKIVSDNIYFSDDDNKIYGNIFFDGDDFFVQNQIIGIANEGSDEYLNTGFYLEGGVSYINVAMLEVGFYDLILYMEYVNDDDEAIVVKETSRFEIKRVPRTMIKNLDYDKEELKLNMDLKYEYAGMEMASQYFDFVWAELPDQVLVQGVHVDGGISHIDIKNIEFGEYIIKAGWFDNDLNEYKTERTIHIDGNNPVISMENIYLDKEVNRIYSDITIDFANRKATSIFHKLSLNNDEMTLVNTGTYVKDGQSYIDATGLEPGKYRLITGFNILDDEPYFDYKIVTIDYDPLIEIIDIEFNEIDNKVYTNITIEPYGATIQYKDVKIIEVDSPEKPLSIGKFVENGTSFVDAMEIESGIYEIEVTAGYFGIDGVRPVEISVTRSFELNRTPVIPEFQEKIIEDEYIILNTIPKDSLYETFTTEDTFEKKYLKFKKDIVKKLYPNHPDTYFENFSIEDNPLFSLNEFYTKEYIYSEPMIDVNFLNALGGELDALYSKFKFTRQYLEDYIKKMERYSKELDEEYFTANGISSLKGDAITFMYKENPEYNHIMDLNIIYNHNCIKEDNSITKISFEEESCKYYLNYKSNNELTFIFDDPKTITEILLSFNKNILLNLFGRKEDGTLEAIATNINSSDHPSIKNKNDNKYNEIVIISYENIAKFFSSANFFSIENKSDYVSDINAYVVHLLKNDNIINKYTVFSTSETQVYEISPTNINVLINDIKNLSHIKIKDKYCNNNKVIKGVEKDYADAEDKIFLEVIPVDVKKIDYLKIFGKELK